MTNASDYSNPGSLEDRLLDECQRLITLRAQSDAARAERVRTVLLRRPHRLVLALGLVVAMAVSVTMALNLSPATPSAYALDREPDGRIRMTIHVPSPDTDGLIRDLEKLGVPTARFPALPLDATCPAGQPAMRLVFMTSAIAKDRDRPGRLNIDLPDNQELMTVVSVDEPLSAAPGSSVVGYLNPGQVAVLATAPPNVPLSWDVGTPIAALWIADQEPTCVSFPDIGQPHRYPSGRTPSRTPAPSSSNRPSGTPQPSSSISHSSSTSSPARQ